MPGSPAARCAAIRRPGEVWSYRAAPHVQKITADWRGSSALFAVKVVLVEAGISGAILAGAPMDRTPHFVRPGAWSDAHAFFPGWYDHRKLITPRLRSMSGWTKQLVGAPTAGMARSDPRGATRYRAHRTDRKSGGTPRGLVMMPHS